MRVIIFDLFDTILDKVWFDYDKVLDYLLSDCFVGVSKDKIEELARCYREKYMLNRNETSIEVSFVDQLKFFEENLGQSIGKDYQEVEWKAFLCCRQEVVVEKATEVLEYFKERGYKLAVLSNSIFSSSTLRAYLEKFGLEKYFDVVESSADIKIRKPAQAAFGFVLEKLGVVASEDIFFVGNSLQKDVNGANSAGLKPIFINKEEDVYSGISVFSLYEVKEFFEKEFLYLNNIMPKESLVDGPGLRTVVFLQGCNRRCVGCHNTSTWSMKDGVRMKVADFAERLKELSKNKKITITGGEPLLQQKAVEKLCEALSDFDICLYTSFQKEDISQVIIKKIHYLKVGEYIQESRTTTTPFVGSSNQRLIDLRRKI